jgi:molybdate transport system permease protein
MLTVEESQVILLSLRVAFACVFVTIPPALVLGWVLARCDFPFKLLIDGICHLPLVMPPVVVGYLLLIAFGRQGILGPWLEIFGLQFVFNWKGAVISSSVVAFPLVLRAVRLAIEDIDPRVERIARTLGASPIRVFFTITLRMAMPGLIVGSLLAFARSLGEFGATITFVSNIAGETRTIPAAIYTYLNQPDGEMAALRLASFSVIISLIALIVSEWSVKRLRRGEIATD